VGAVVSFTDVTELRQQAVQLKLHHTHLEDLVTQRTQELSAALQAKLALESFAQLMSDHQPTLLAYWTRDLRLAFANRAFAEWFGATRDDLIGRHYDDIVGRAMREQQQQQLDRALAGETVQDEFDLTRHDGHRGHFLVVRVPDRRPDIPDAGFVAASTDITELTLARQRAEPGRGAQPGEQFLRRVSDSVPSMIAYWDQDQCCRFANQAYLDWMGRPAEAVIGHTMREVLGEEFLAHNQPHRRRAAGRAAGSGAHPGAPRWPGRAHPGHLRAAPHGRRRAGLHRGGDRRLAPEADRAGARPPTRPWPSGPTRPKPPPAPRAPSWPT
jgi:PAS domain S-box-containing protein